MTESFETFEDNRLEDELHHLAEIAPSAKDLSGMVSGSSEETAALFHKELTVDLVPGTPPKG